MHLFIQRPCYSLYLECFFLSYYNTWHRALPLQYLLLGKVFLGYPVQNWIPLPVFPNPFSTLCFSKALLACKILNILLIHFIYLKKIKTSSLSITKHSKYNDWILNSQYRVNCEWKGIWQMLTNPIKCLFYDRVT